MAVPDGTHEIGGLKLQKTSGARWPYVVVEEDYEHNWIRQPRMGSARRRTISDQKKDVVVATFQNDSVVTLHVGYGWDGNSGPAVNTDKCLRASAVHDVWCQAMYLRILENSFRNWAAGASEYRQICRKDGMSWLRAGWRLVAIMGYGGWKKITGKLRP